MKNKTIYALGFFDGVHIGHGALLNSCRELAREGGWNCGVVTFSAHPDTLVLGQTPRLINTPEDRERLLREGYGVDTVVTLPFDRRMRDMSWKDFLDLLRREYDAAGFVCGEDFRFGAGGVGNAGLLAIYCRAESLPWAVVPEQTLDGIRISSTHIRGLIEKGEMSTAVKFLGHPHILTGQVIHGRHLGSTLGIPTANLRLEPMLAVPKFGVYICRCIVDGKAYPAVTNVGTRPTVNGQDITVEPWILDYEGDLYGREIMLEFYAFLRPERKFPDLQALKAEILRNADQTRAFFREGSVQTTFNFQALFSSEK